MLNPKIFLIKQQSTLMETESYRNQYFTSLHFINFTSSVKPQISEHGSKYFIFFKIRRRCNRIEFLLNL